MPGALEKAGFKFIETGLYPALTGSEITLPVKACVTHILRATTHHQWGMRNPPLMEVSLYYALTFDKSFG